MTKVSFWSTYKSTYLVSTENTTTHWFSKDAPSILERPLLSHFSNKHDLLFTKNDLKLFVLLSLNRSICDIPYTKYVLGQKHCSTQASKPWQWEVSTLLKINCQECPKDWKLLLAFVCSLEILKQNLEKPQHLLLLLVL